MPFRRVFPALVAFALLAFPLHASAQIPPEQPALQAPAPETTEVASARKVSLAEAVRRALAANPSAAIAQAQISRAEALVRQARAGSFPTLTANAIYTRLDESRTLGEPPNQRVLAGANQLSANLTLSVPILAPQKWYQWSHAKDNAAVVRINAEETKRIVAVATARSYLTVIAQHRVVEVQERSIKTASTHLVFAKSQSAAGAGTRIDEIRAEQEQATAVTLRENALAALAKAQQALGVLIASEGPVDASEEFSLPSAPRSESEAIREASAKRTDVQALRARVGATSEVIRHNWADFSPSLTGVFQPSYQYQSPQSDSQPSTAWQAQLILSIPLYDGGARYGLQDERRANVAEATATLDNAVRQLSADVRVAMETVKRADAALESARKAAALAAEALSLSDLAYRSGASTNLEVIDAERRARDAETAAAVAEDAARQARLDLLVATGRFP